MHNHDQVRPHRRKAASDRRATKKVTSSAITPPASSVPQIYEVVIKCRHEAEQRAVYERMCGEGFRCRVLTL